jgi:NADH-quinone oxidoreductase subunit M
MTVLTWLILIPLVGGVLAWIAARWSALASRWIALTAAVIDFGIALALWQKFPVLLGASRFVEVNVSWVPRFGLSYHLALDGLNMLLVLLTGLLAIVAVACSWREITERVGEFHLALMTLVAAILGTFMAFDLLLFFFFWEAMLVPMYFLIAIWGHENRRYAAIKFFLFTFIGGLFVLLGVIGLYVFSGKGTFDYDALIGTAVPARAAMLLMLGLLFGFAVKLPVVPLHTWLPDAHTEAPTAGSVLLAGLLLKTGAYGMLRFAIPLFPTASAEIAPIMMALGAAGILYGALLAYAQTDLKRMVAYTSVSHMGFVLLGIYAGTAIALQGAILAIICHGLATGALFAIVGMIQERTGTRELSKLGGLWATTPKLGGFTLFFALAALGLPGLGNFAAEFLVLLGAFTVNPVIASIAALGLVASVIYALRLMQQTMLGANENAWRLTDLSAREIAILGVLAVLLLWLGLHPQPVFDTAKNALATVEQALPTGDPHE